MSDMLQLVVRAVSCKFVDRGICDGRLRFTKSHEAARNIDLKASDVRLDQKKLAGAGLRGGVAAHGGRRCVSV